MTSLSTALPKSRRLKRGLLRMVNKLLTFDLVLAKARLEWRVVLLGLSASADLCQGLIDAKKVD